MTDVFDRASTLNFTTVATVRGLLTEPKLRAALGCLERRHPLLTARVQREQEPWSLIPGEGAPLSLQVQEGGTNLIESVLSTTLCHREWADVGPRAELTWLRHAPDHSTLLLCLHHTVSDGSSGILAMRDLLAFLDQPEDVATQELAAPAQDSFFPPLYGQLRERFMASLAQKPPATGRTVPYRLRTAEDIPLTSRSARTLGIRLSVEQTARLARFARSAGATVHGVLCASLALAHAQEVGQAHVQRVAHPVSMRRYLQERFPQQPPIGDAVGYYVSSVETEHALDPQRDLSALAREVSEAVRARKDEHEPFLSAPIRGPLVAERAAKLGWDAFRTWAEHKVFTSTFALSNLGELEKLGAQSRVGALHVEDFYFAIAGSVMGALGCAAVSFAGQITLQLTYVHPLVTHEVAARLRQRVEAQLMAI